MRPLLLLVLCAGIGNTAVATRHRTTLKGSIQSPPAIAPMQPMVDPGPSQATNGSLISHGSYLYALIGDRVYKLDPKNMHVLAVQQLTGRASSYPGKAAKGRKLRRRPVEEP